MSEIDPALGFMILLEVLIGALIVGEVLRRLLAKSPRYYRHLKVSAKRWIKVFKSQPRRHGVIPKDYEPFGLPASQRPYLHDYSLSLRPGRAYKPLAVTDPDQAFHRRIPLENPLELID